MCASRARKRVRLTRPSSRFEPPMPAIAASMAHQVATEQHPSRAASGKCTSNCPIHIRSSRQVSALLIASSTRTLMNCELALPFLILPRRSGRCTEAQAAGGEVELGTHANEARGGCYTEGERQRDGSASRGQALLGRDTQSMRAWRLKLAPTLGEKSQVGIRVSGRH